MLRVGRGVYRLCRLYHDYVFWVGCLCLVGGRQWLALCVCVLRGGQLLFLYVYPYVVVVYTMVVCMVPVLRRLGNV